MCVWRKERRKETKIRGCGGPSFGINRDDADDDDDDNARSSGAGGLVARGRVASQELHRPMGHGRGQRHLGDRGRILGHGAVPKPSIGCPQGGTSGSIVACGWRSSSKVHPVAPPPSCCGARASYLFAVWVPRTWFGNAWPRYLPPTAGNQYRTPSWSSFFFFFFFFFFFKTEMTLDNKGQDMPAY